MLIFSEYHLRTFFINAGFSVNSFTAWASIRETTSVSWGVCGKAEYGLEVIIVYSQVHKTDYLSVWMPLFWGVVKPNMDKKSWWFTAISDLPSLSLNVIVLGCGEAVYGYEGMMSYSQVWPAICHLDFIVLRCGESEFGHEVMTW